MPSTTRQKRAPPSPNAIQTPLPPPTTHHSERSTRNGSAYRAFSYPAVRPPTRSHTPLTPVPRPRAHSNRHYVFVYGTLKRGFANSHYLDRATYLGDFRTVTKYPLVVGGRYHSPYLLDLPAKGSKVKGELWAVDDATLADLDHLENVGVNYSRKVAKVSSAADRAFVADAYIYFKVNGMGDLVEKPYLDDYQCRKYIPRHQRHKDKTNTAPTSVARR
eukprot:GFKZ01002608.1.p1 GENE.GFKZ01002608.1~~GFKZ01002608.1.p1  ORF type:complete len:250 (-),score=23.12 GFKZ01002608.1:1038-1691(-)